MSTRSRLGWRVWGIGETDDGPMLCSPLADRDATARTTTFKAECPVSVHEQPGLPSTGVCQCGVYCVAARDQLTPFYPADACTRVLMHNPQRPGTVFLPGELLSQAVTIRGPATVSPDFERHIPALARRYGIPFSVDPALAGHPLDAVSVATAQALNSITVAFRELDALLRDGS